MPEGVWVRVPPSALFIKPSSLNKVIGLIFFLCIMFNIFKNLFKKKKTMKILVQNYVLTFEDNKLSVINNEDEKEIMSLSGSEIGEFKRAMGYIEQEANV